MRGSWSGRRQSLLTSGPRLDVLILCAGFDMVGPYLKHDEARLRTMLRTNVESTMSLARALMPVMVERRQGAVLLVSSMAGNQPSPHFAPYAATKAAISSLGEALHHELRSTGVTRIRTRARSCRHRVFRRRRSHLATRPPTRVHDRDSRAVREIGDARPSLRQAQGDATATSGSSRMGRFAPAPADLVPVVRVDDEVTAPALREVGQPNARRELRPRRLRPVFEC